MARLSGWEATRSDLLPARAMMMFSFAWRWSSLTQALALSREDCEDYVSRLFFLETGSLKLGRLGGGE